jgi:ketosteroid isomerase-like protein
MSHLYYAPVSGADTFAESYQLIFRLSMKKILLSLGTLALFALSMAAPLAAATGHSASVAVAPTLTPDEQLFTGLIEQVGAAIGKGDMTALGKYMAPDYVHYTPDNSTGTRAQDLAYVGTWSATTVKLAGPVKVTRKGDMAVTVATSVYTGQFKGKPFKNTIQMMIAWVLRDGKWQMAVVQSKVMPA